MKLLLVTAGAANMYCGSCFRDNTLAATLRAQGHDVTLVPLYTPVRTDEPGVAIDKVFFGGISVYLEQHVGALRRAPAWIDWLWDRPGIIRLLSRRSVSVDPATLGALTVSMLRGEHGHQRREFDKLVAWLRAQPRPDVISLPHTLLISLAGPLGRALDRPVACTLQGEDLFLDGLLEPYRSQALDLIREQVAEVDVFLAVSDYYAAHMAGYLSIPRSKIRVVRLGINTDGYEDESRPVRRAHEPFTVGYFARIAPEKGLHVLCEAYRHLRQDEGLAAGRLRAAGYLAAEHRDYLGSIERRLRDWGLAAEFEYAGELDRDGKIAFLRGVDVVSVPTPYAEPKGLFLLEALACGTPVVQPRRGAFPELIARTGGGLVVDADRPAELARALHALARDPAGARDLGRAGAQGVRAHYAADVMARQALVVFQELTDRVGVA
jgi:glycosyltransferase involved in cell wall biosynthesis